MIRNKLARRTTAVAVPVVAFVIGAGVATAGTTTPEATAETVTETQTVEVSKTPQACLDALDYSDKLTEYFVEALGIAGDSIMNASTFDLDALDANTAELEAMTPKVESARGDYDVAATECRVAQS